MNDFVSYFPCPLPAVLRMRHPQPPVGFRDLRHLDLPGVQRAAPRPRRPPLLRALSHHGQVEGLRAQQDEGANTFSSFHFQKSTLVVASQASSNAKAKAFLEDHTDWNPSAPIRTKWNTRAAALYKDKVSYLHCLPRLFFYAQRLVQRNVC